MVIHSNGNSFKWDLERIVSVSSEDPIFKAENLLKKLKWRCQNNGEQQVSVVLQLDKSVQIRLLEKLELLFFFFKYFSLFFQ